MKKSGLFFAALLIASFSANIARAEVLETPESRKDYTLPIVVNDDLTIIGIDFNGDDEFTLNIKDKAGKTYQGTATVTYMRELVCDSPADRRKAYGATEADWDCSSDKAALLSIFKEWAKEAVDAAGQDGDVQFDENGEPIF